MKNSLLILFVTLSISTSLSQTFEDRGNTIEQWDILDLKGDAKIYPLSDHSCPPGFGPEVLHVEGGLVLGMAKNQKMQDGTFVALYRENRAGEKDADGIILIKSEYPQDISKAHNTKEKRPHMWLEQDNDCGVQLRYFNSEGKEENLAEKCGTGVVTDKWNRTGWIWQKVQVEGDVIRAKTWPAHLAEPEEWVLETKYKRGEERFGFKINSGDINLAYFAADSEDIPIEVPGAFLYAPVMRITQTSKIDLVLFTNHPENTKKELNVKAVCNGKTIADSPISLEIPEGSNEFNLVLTTGVSDVFESEFVVKMLEEPKEGAIQIIISDASGNIIAEREMVVLPVHRMRERFDQRKETLKELSNVLKNDKSGLEAYKSIKVIHDAAKAHLDNAIALFDGGDPDDSDMAFRFVDEALGELSGYKKEFLSELNINENLTTPAWDENDKRGFGAPKSGILDAYSMKYLLSFGKPEIDAQSFVMGQTYNITIPWTVVGGVPDKDYDFEVRMVSPLGNRIVAKSTTRTDIPTSKWEPGETYKQNVELKISPEDPEMGKGQPEQPAVLDEYHYMLISVIDPETGAKLILGNDPGPQPERVGQSFCAGQYYISSTPLEITHFTSGNSKAGEMRNDSFSISNVGGSSIYAGVLFSVTTESGELIYQNYKPQEINPGESVPMLFNRESNWAGELNVHIQIVKEGKTLTEAKRDISVAMDGDVTVAVSKENHVKEKNGKYYTPVIVECGRKKAEVSVFANGRLVGSAKGSKFIVVNAEPWFGYYDVVVAIGKNSYAKRIIATVIETQGMDMIVNGEPFLIKGVNVHGLDGRSPEKSASMMRIMRELGFNAWRGDYPPLWQMELAYELNSFYTVLGPFSCTGTDEIFARQVGPPMATARELSRLLVERYKNSAGVLLWNSCNEIVGENRDFLETLKPVFKTYDPYSRPVHYSNLYGQNLHNGQDAMGVNYYFGAGQTAKDRQPLIQRSIDISRENNIPVMYNEFNSYAGAVHSTGVEAMYGMYEWGIEQGMCGGFQYMKGNSTSHPGIFDTGYNTQKIYNEAIIDVLADAKVSLKSTEIKDGKITIRIKNKRRFTLRQIKITLKASGIEMEPLKLTDITPKSVRDITVRIPEKATGKAITLKGHIEFVTHYGFKNKIPISLIATK